MPEDARGAAGPATIAGRRVRALRDQLGPGLVSGAVDTDPSGIATYTQAGAQLGYTACWLILLCYPMMIATQDISARIGRASGGGIIALLRRVAPGWVVAVLATGVACANTFNLGADLGAMADVCRLLFGGSRNLYVALMGTFSVASLLLLRLAQYILLVKWAAASLLIYVAAALLAAPSWLGLHAVAIPARDGPTLSIVVAVLGTTISPYLLIWQSALEGEQSAGQKQPTAPDKRRIRLDTVAGMTVAALLAYAVIVTAAANLHGAGTMTIASAADAAQALRRVAGRLTDLLFSLGVVSTGLLAVPMLAGSTAFAIGEGLGWKVGLARVPRTAWGFYGSILAGTAAGAALTLLDINPMRALIWSAVINGLASVPVLVAMMLLAGSRERMGALALSRPLALLGWLTVAVMGLIALGLLATAT